MILALDPGTTQSGWVRFDGRVHASGVMSNEVLLCELRQRWPMYPDLTGCAIEVFEARGMPIGKESIETMLWTGRFLEAWHGATGWEAHRVQRSAVQLHLCGSARAKDPNVRQALIDRLGVPGTKKAPGGTYGVTSHAWAALGVAVTAAA